MPDPDDAPGPRPTGGITSPQFARAYTSTSDDLMTDPVGTRIYFNASTSTLARDGMSLRPERWRLDNYHRSGGPVLWAHKHDMPAIGTGAGMTEPSRLRIGVAFDQEDPFARSVESKVRRRFIRGSSVAWDFVDSSGRVVRSHRFNPEQLTRDLYYDLSEFSIVNVPSDPQAVAERHWGALRSLDPRLADLYVAQERFDSDVTAPELRQAVVELCTHLGIDVNVRAADVADDDEPQQDAARRLLHVDELPTLLRGYGFKPSTNDPAPAGGTASASAAVDNLAAQEVLAAFPNLKG